MRQVFQSPIPSARPPARWHEAFDEPSAADEIEVDLGDHCVWRGVRFAPEVEAFVDVDSGGAITVLMWRYVQH